MFRFTLLLVSLVFTSCAFSQDKTFSIIHFNDLHSRFQGFAPTIDFTPYQINNDATKGVGQELQLM